MSNLIQAEFNIDRVFRELNSESKEALEHQYILQQVNQSKFGQSRSSVVSANGAPSKERIAQMQNAFGYPKMFNAQRHIH
jgi:hypothetical protein